MNKRFLNQSLLLTSIALSISTVIYIPALAQDSISEEQASKTHFEKVKIKIAQKTISVELADTYEKQAQGLMYRTKMPKDLGMLFVFPFEETRYFWMKNTKMDLSIAYFDASRKIIDIQEMKAPSPMELNPPSYPSKGPAKYALEMESGWFSRNKIKLGDSFQFLTSPKSK